MDSSFVNQVGHAIVPMFVSWAKGSASGSATHLTGMAVKLCPETNISCGHVGVRSCSSYASRELGGEVIGGCSGGRRDLDHPVIRFAPRRGVAQLDFADALDDGLPEAAEHDEWARLHHAFVQHFPHDS